MARKHEDVAADLEAELAAERAARVAAQAELEALRTRVIDATSAAANLATRDNILSDGPGTVQEV